MGDVQKGKRFCLCCSRNATISALLIVGIVLLIGGCVLIPEFPKILNNQIKKVYIYKYEHV